MTGALAFTCLLPVHAADDPDDFRAAIASLAASTRQPDELLLCQDGAVPEALAAAIAQGVASLAARVIVNPGPRGLQHNLNHALTRVRTPWVARCDADDLNLPRRFEEQAAFLRDRPEIGVLGGDIVEFWPDGRERRKTMPLAHEQIVAWARWRSPVNHNTAFYRTADVLACGGYPDLPFKEDYGLWLRLIGRGVRFANLRQDLVRARLGERFYARRAGLRNLGSEWSLYEIRRGIPELSGWTAVMALTARSLALASAGPARLIYEGILRR